MGKITIVLILFFVGLSVNAQPVNEVIVAPEQGRQWQAQVVENDVYWQRPACVASTMAEDGLSTLEVISFYDEVLDAFTEPTVHVITTFDVSFFEVEVTADNSQALQYSFLPVALTQNQIDGNTMVGARALMGDREELVSVLRQRNRVEARYFDSQGEVKSLTFSLRGSSHTLQTMFAHCDLSFSPEILDLEPLPAPN